jgi:hypothetical protein
MDPATLYVLYALVGQPPHWEQLSTYALKEQCEASGAADVHMTTCAPVAPSARWLAHGTLCPVPPYHHPFPCHGSLGDVAPTGPSNAVRALRICRPAPALGAVAIALYAGPVLKGGDYGSASLVCALPPPPATRVLLDEVLEVVEVVDTDVDQDRPYKAAWAIWPRGTSDITPFAEGTRFGFTCEFFDPSGDLSL